MAGAAPGSFRPDSLVGREREIVAVRELLERSRLVTLTGPGGTGKTRLALASVDERAAFVPLAPVADPALVATAVAQALGVQEVAGQPLERTLGAHLRDRELLLCIDNFEHLLEAAPLVSELLACAPGLRVLATSRAPLRLLGEQEYPVPSLEAGEAVSLFELRARQARPDFALADGDRAVVVEICGRLDRLPLAIELAAARTRALPLTKLRERLENSLSLLTQGRRDAPARQQTLRATIEWSYGLLSPDEQVLVRRLSVFRGGATLEVAEAVCDADLGTLTSLVEQSLLKESEDEHDGPRYALLETIREYALERLRDSVEENEYQRRHAEHFAAFAREAEHGLFGVQHLAWLDRIAREADNLRAAMAWALAHEPSLCLTVASGVWAYWESRAPVEGRRWLAESLRRGATLEPEEQTVALVRLANLALYQGDCDESDSRLTEAILLARKSAATEGLALALALMIWVTKMRGLPEQAQQFAEEVARLIPQLETPWIAADVRNLLAGGLSDRAQAVPLLEESLARWREIGSPACCLDVLNNIAMFAILDGRYDEARHTLEEGLETARSLRDSFRTCIILGNLGNVATLQGDCARAAEVFGESLPVLVERGDRRLVAESFVCLAAVAAARDDDERAARLLGAFDALFETMETPPQELEIRIRDERVMEAAVRLGTDRFHEMHAAGRTMPFAEAVACALDVARRVRDAIPTVEVQAGVQLGGYVLESEVGRGGMGVVWRARQTSLGRIAAVKVLASRLAGDEAFRQRFLGEARLAASLDHPHVLPVFEAGESDGQLFLATRFVAGEDLGSLLAREGSLGAERAVALVSQLASALDTAHAMGLVHRDVKPANVLLDGSHAYLCDFGLAKPSDGGSSLTQAGAVVGTLDYLAPEAIETGEAGPAADVYALACVLYECLTGEVPFPRPSDVAKLWAHVQEPPPSLAQVHAGLDVVVQRGLAKRPEERFATAGELAAAAEAALSAPLPAAARPPLVWPEGLPRPLTPLVGRGSELADLGVLLGGDEVRLVTLTGPAGTGKTRLALHAAAETSSRLADGAVFCDLSPLRDSALVASAIALALGLRERSGQTNEATIADHVAGKELLLVLDNFEHLVDGAALVSRLLVACPQLRVLVTSRIPLRLGGEREFPVDTLTPADAAALFLERASALGPEPANHGFASSATVEAICQRLDRLPLALELAAVRLRTLSPDALLARLEQRLPLLTGGARDAPERQRTLRAAIAWSYDLLAPDEQTALARVAVFAGGFTLDAAEAVCDTKLETLDALVEQSFVRHRNGRYTMLETIREYAAEQQGADADIVLAAHARWFLERVSELVPQNVASADTDWVQHFDAELDNLRLALATLARTDPAAELELVARLFALWDLHGLLGEGVGRIQAALGRAGGERTMWVARAQAGAAWLSTMLGQHEQAIQLAREARLLAAQYEAPETELQALHALGVAHLALGHFNEARDALSASVLLARQTSSPQLPDSLVNLANVHMLLEQYQEAAALTGEAVEVARGLGRTLGVGYCLLNHATSLIGLGRVEEALSAVTEALVSFASAEHPQGVAYCTLQAAELALIFGHVERASELLGASDTVGASIDLEQTPIGQRIQRRIVDAGTQELGEAAFAAARAYGSTLTIAEAVEMAVALRGPAS